MTGVWRSYRRQASLVPRISRTSKVSKQPKTFCLGYSKVLKLRTYRFFVHINENPTIALLPTPTHLHVARCRDNAVHSILNFFEVNPILSF